MWQSLTRYTTGTLKRVHSSVQRIHANNEGSLMKHLFLLMLLTLISTTAFAEPPVVATYRYNTYLSPTCWEKSTQPSPYGGVLAWANTCNESANQKWNVRGISYTWEGGWPGIQSWNPVAFENAAGQCLAVENYSSADGAKLVVTTCNYSDPNQQWVRQTNPGQYEIWYQAKFQNVRSGKCIDQGSDQPGVVLQQWKCSSNSDYHQQRFYTW